MFRMHLLRLLLVMLVFSGSLLFADNNKTRVEVFLKDEPLLKVVKFVSKKTGKNFIIDSSPHHIKDVKLTFLSSKPMSLEELYDEFLNVLDQNSLQVKNVGKFMVISQRGCVLKGYVDAENTDNHKNKDSLVQPIMIKHPDKNFLKKEIEKKLSSKGKVEFYSYLKHFFLVTDSKSHLEKILPEINKINVE